MKVRNLREKLITSFSRFISQDEATNLAQEVIEAHVRKAPRSNILDEVLGDLAAWQSKPEAKWEVALQLPGYTAYNGNGLGPMLKLPEIQKTLIRQARQNGIAMASVTNAKAFHALHIWVQGLAKQGLFAIASYNGGPDGVIPLNGTTGLLGTNPIAFGFPGDKGDICIDMATSEIPYFHIVDAKKKGEGLPPNAAVDASGNLTTNASKALTDAGVSNLTPMGNTYKGYNLVYALEVMTSALIGAKISAMQDPGYVAEEHGGFIIAISIDALTNRKLYDEAVRTQNEEIRAQKPRKGTPPIIVPGDTNLARKMQLSEDMDIDLPESTLKKLA